MNNNIRVGSLFGIPFYINPSWFLVLGLVTLSYGQDLARFPQLTGILPWFLGLVTALLLFASVLAHELGHSFVALAQGIEVKSISLFLLGGLASLEKESNTPWQAFSVAIAGPLVSVLLFGLLSILGTQLTLSAPAQAILGLLAAINLALAIFNLIPGLPLDGGNVLKSIVWQVTGNQNRGILVASRVGQAFGGLAILLGGLSVLNLVPIGSLWTILIGVFLLQNAGASARDAQVKEQLEAFTARDAVVDDSPIIPQGLNIRQFANEYVIGKPSWRRFLVVNSEQRLIGVLSVDDIKHIPTSEWPHTTIDALVKSPGTLLTVNAEQTLFEVAQVLDQAKVSELLVTQDNGELVGLLEKTAITKCLQSALA